MQKTWLLSLEEQDRFQHFMGASTVCLRCNGQEEGEAPIEAAETADLPAPPPMVRCGEDDFQLMSQMRTGDTLLLRFGGGAGSLLARITYTDDAPSGNAQALFGVEWLMQLSAEQAPAVMQALDEVPPLGPLPPLLGEEVARLMPAQMPVEDVAQPRTLNVRRMRTLRFPLLCQSPYGERILRDFRWREYLHANPDVAANVTTEVQALNHFLNQGYYENRIFDPTRVRLLDPGFYRARYPELGLQSDDLAQIHYCYQGYYEDRLPNATTEWLYNASLHVFQMGKIGSHSIASALSEAYAGKVLHLHWLTDIFANFPSCGLPYSKLLVHEREAPVKVISGVREIVSWTASGIFQYYGQRVDDYEWALELIQGAFLEKCESGLAWFDHQYFCGLDVYAHPFDTERGFTRIQHSGLDLFLYRQEDLPNLEQPLADFLDLSEFHLGHKNVGGEKTNQTIYRRVMRDLRLPGNVLARLYDTPFMQHFYSDREREQFFDRWAASSA